MAIQSSIVDLSGVSLDELLNLPPDVAMREAMASITVQSALPLCEGQLAPKEDTGDRRLPSES